MSTPNVVPIVPLNMNTLSHAGPFDIPAPTAEAIAFNTNPFIVFHQVNPTITAQEVIIANGSYTDIFSFGNMSIGGAGPDLYTLTSGLPPPYDMPAGYTVLPQLHCVTAVVGQAGSQDCDWAALCWETGNGIIDIGYFCPLTTSTPKAGFTPPAGTTSANYQITGMIFQATTLTWTDNCGNVTVFNLSDTSYPAGFDTGILPLSPSQLTCFLAHGFNYGGSFTTDACIFTSNFTIYPHVSPIAAAFSGLRRPTAYYGRRGSPGL